METIKHYETNRYKSVLFYLSIGLPLLTIYLTILSFQHNISANWPGLLFFYVFAIPTEIIAIKYRKTLITINDEGIIIKNSNVLYQTNWTNIASLEEALFGQGELYYRIMTKDKKIFQFTSSIENCNDLLKEIEERSGLKFKVTI